MQIRRRSVRISAGAGDSSCCEHAQTVLRDLIAETAGLDGGALDTWPALDHAGEALSISCDGWSSATDPTRRLVTIALADATAGWKQILSLAATSVDELLICNEIELPTGGAFDGVPDLFAPLYSLACSDIDGMVAGAVRRVDRISVSRFVAFLRDPQRQLPVVLLSPTDEGVFLIDKHECARALFGMAHVVVLSPRFRWHSDSLPLQRHACYGGNVRVYQPGFADDQEAGVHRYWKRDQIEDSPERALRQLVTYISNAFGVGSWRHPDLDRLADERAAEAQQARVDRAVSRLRTALKLNFDADIDEALQLLIERDDEIATLRSLLNDKEQSLKTNEYKLRALQFQLNHAWVVSDEPDPPNVAPESALRLSDQAQSLLDDVDVGERARIEELLMHLLDPQLRESQCEVVNSGEPLRVYPRGRSASGRRIIYYGDETALYVCEVFPNHDDYDAARTRGAIYQARYVTFAPARLMTHFQQA